MPEEDIDCQGKLLANLLHFGRILRQLGIQVSSQQIYELAIGITNIDISKRLDFYNTTRAYLLHDNDKKEQFDIAFDLLWTQQIKAMLEFLISHRVQGNITQEENVEGRKFKSQSIISPNGNDLIDNLKDRELNEKKINPRYSSLEMIYRKDFGDLDKDEIKKAIIFLKTLSWQFGRKRTLRKIPSTKHTSYLDFRRTLRNNMYNPGEIIKLEWHRRKIKPRPLVVICDISGSMERYSQVFLYFLYAMAQRSRRIETFVFATRLTRLTPVLRKKDVNLVIHDLSNVVLDWSGGTRIGKSLKDFNFHWSRRVLGAGSMVVIISDGWDRGDQDLLKLEISRLQRSVNKLIWVNPLAGSPDYEPLVQGIQTVLPHVDEFLPMNNLQNLESLVIKLGSIV